MAVESQEEVYHQFYLGVLGLHVVAYLKIGIIPNYAHIKIPTLRLKPSHNFLVLTKKQLQYLVSSQLAHKIAKRT
jgi:hypothetical protein